MSDPVQVSHSVERPVRTPLARGRVYSFPGWPSGFEVTHVAFRGHPEDDGGLQGVAIRWLHFSGRRGGFYPFKCEKDFWAHLLFKDAYDAPEGFIKRRPNHRV